MKILSLTKPVSGIKLTQKQALQVATLRNLFGTKKGFKTLKNVTKQVADISTDTYKGNDAIAATTLSKIIKRKYPELAAAAKKIDVYCEKNAEILNNTQGQKSKELSNFVKKILDSLSEKTFQLDKMQPSELGIMA